MTDKQPSAPQTQSRATVNRQVTHYKPMTASMMHLNKI